MAISEDDSSDESVVLLSRDIATRRETRLAFAAVSISFACFVIVAPFAARRVASLPAFIPAYESTLVLSDLLTAIVLFGQLSFVRSRALWVLAIGYLLTAILALAHLLSFPGVFSSLGLLAGGSQTTVRLYALFHGAFPLSVILYALLQDGRNSGSRSDSAEEPKPRDGGSWRAGVGVALALSAALIGVASLPGGLLPLLLRDGFTVLMKEIVSGLCVICLVALTALWRRRERSALDLWLMVVMCAWLFEMSLGQLFTFGRYDLGWYVGRVYGLLASTVLLILLLIQAAAYHGRLTRLSLKLERLSQHDGLTGIANRRRFDDYLSRQVAVTRRQRRPVALILCDVDAFKAFNDQYGHQAGDDCLIQVAAALQACCRRPADLAARYGGEEFALILPETEMAGALQIAEAARAAVAALQMPHGRSIVGPHVTISGGVSVLSFLEGASAEDLVTSADRALFQAKSRGRNRMVPASLPHIVEVSSCLTAA